MLLFSIGVPCVACGSPEHVPPPARLGCGPRVVEAEDDIREATLRHLLGGKCEQLERASDADMEVCVGIEGDPQTSCDVWPCDPSSSFMKRFSSQAAAIRVASDCPLDAYPIRSRTTGARAVVVTTGDICWVASDRIEIVARESLGLGSDMSFLLNLTRSWNGWVVSSCRVTGVS